MQCKLRKIIYSKITWCKYAQQCADVSDRAVILRPFPWWNCVFESRRRHGYLYLVSVVCCQLYRIMRRAHHSSRGFLPRVMCAISVITQPHQLRPWPGEESNHHCKELHNSELCWYLINCVEMHGTRTILRWHILHLNLHFTMKLNKLV
jgi:hypothetical protein